MQFVFNFIFKKREICGKNNSIKVIKVDSIFIFFFLIL